jgi:hypothetical protein
MQPAKYSKLALALLALSATACAPAIPSQTTTTPSASPGAPMASMTPSMAPAGASATPGPTAIASATATASTPAAVTQFVVLSGTVYDETGATITGAVVKVNSLDPNNRYTQTVTTNQGSYVVRDVPEGVNVEITATKTNWTSRRRVGSFQAAATTRNQIDFGSPLADNTNPGAAYFISKYPEVTSTLPLYDASNVDPSTLSYQFTLSEPLDETNKRRFEDAIRILPANKAASPTGPFIDLQDTVDTTTAFKPDTGNQWAYTIKKGSLFLNDVNVLATVTWNDANTVATLTFPAPLGTNRDDSGKYEAALVAGSDPIVDPFNNKLGIYTPDPANGNKIDGTLIRSAFLPNTLTINGTPGTAAARVIATHQSISDFSVKLMSAPPVLTGVAYTKNLGTDSRFELTFNEPMAAYNGTQLGRIDASLSTGTLLDTLSFAVSDKVGGTSRDNLKGPVNSPFTFGFNIGFPGSNGSPLLSSATGIWGGSSSQLDSEFKLDRNAFTTTLRSRLVSPGDTGRLTIEVNPRNARQVFIYVFNRANLFDSTIAEIKARAEQVGDPSGNISKSADADSSVVAGHL